MSVSGHYRKFIFQYSTNKIKITRILSSAEILVKKKPMNDFQNNVDGARENIPQRKLHWSTKN